MYKFVLPLFLATLFFACGEDDDNSPVEDDPDTELVENFKLSGKIDNAAGQEVTVETFSQNGVITVARTTTDNDGNFEIIGNIPDFGIYQLRVGSGKEHVIPLTLVPKDKVKINTTLEKMATEPNLSGPEWTGTLNEYMELVAEFNRKQPALLQKQGTVSDEQLQDEYLALKKPMDDFAVSTMTKQPENPFNVVLAMSLTPQMGFEKWDPSYLDAMKRVHEAYLKRFESSPMTNTLGNQIQQIEAALANYEATKANQKTDGQAPEISLKTPKGKTITLSSLRGKYVLIDFWASWCGPCRKENPNVVRIYNKYKDKGFTVFSVSLDKDAEAWKRAIEADNLSWPNHGSDLLMWDSPVREKYGFDGIPYTVLVDPDGNIVATKLRGTALEQKLEEIFAN